MHKKILGFLSGIRLRNFLIIAFSIVILMTSLAIGLISLSDYTEILLNKTKNSSMDISSQVAYALDSTLIDLNKRVGNIANHPYMQSVLIQKDSPLDEYEKSEYLKIVHNYFDPFSIESFYIRSIDLYLKDSKGTVLQKGSEGSIIEDIFNSQYYNKGIQRPTTLCPIGFNESTKTIDTVRLIYDLETYEIKAILLIRIDEKYLYNTFMNYNQLDNNDIYIIDEYGQILSSENINYIGDYFNGEYLNLMSGSSGLIDYKDNFILYKQLQQQKWKVIIFIPENMIYKDIYTIRNKIVLYMMAFILLGIVISTIISLIVTVPIKEIVKAMKRTQTGNFDVQIDSTGFLTTEIAYLTKSFNNMVIHIKTLINNIYTEKTIRQKMELKALQDQINPHFLFNTLDIINWKARKYKAHEICDMIQSLSYLLQVNMGRIEGKLILIKDEIKYIQHYVHLVKMKYGDKINFAFEIDQEITECKIPKLILQPFIENSINHGLVNKIGIGTVTVESKCINGTLNFVIKDDGVGISIEKLDEINNNLSMETVNEADDVGSSLALRNIYRRIKLLYGEEYGFTIDSQLYHGTTVTINIPREMEDE